MNFKNRFEQIVWLRGKFTSFLMQVAEEDGLIMISQELNEAEKFSTELLMELTLQFLDKMKAIEMKPSEWILGEISKSTMIPSYVGDLVKSVVKTDVRRKRLMRFIEVFGSLTDIQYPIEKWSRLE